jgi:transcriptional regulator with XRE-family HTH domain
MEAEQCAEHGHSIWKTLPLHPHPQPFESLTGYMRRLAEANGLKSTGQLIALVGIPGNRRESVYRFPDYPAPSYYTGFAQLTGCPEERLQYLTFLPLAQHFGRTVNLPHLHRFLGESLASSLRYCSCCLASNAPPYYSLLWRFLVLPGCLEHSMRLLDHCGHCGSLLPLLSSLPHLLTCPTCQGDLRTSPQMRLSDEDLQVTQRYTQELSMLLEPIARPLPEAQATLLGKHCMALRQRQDLSITELARLSGQEPSVILDIEQVRSFPKASFDDYIQYVEALSCSLFEVFDADRLQAFLIPPSQEEVFNQIESAIQQLLRQGEHVTKRNIRNLVGLETALLGRYGLAWTFGTRPSFASWQLHGADVKANQDLTFGSGP